MTIEKPPIPVHALDDQRVHLAPPHHGRLRQGRLKTLCGKLAVSELPLFAVAAAKGRCPKCFAIFEGNPAATAEKKAAKAPPPARRQAATPAAKAKKPAKRQTKR